MAKPTIRTLDPETRSTGAPESFLTTRAGNNLEGALKESLDLLALESRIEPTRSLPLGTTTPAGGASGPHEATVTG